MLIEPHANESVTKEGNLTSSSQRTTKSTKEMIRSEWPNRSEESELRCCLTIVVAAAVIAKEPVAEGHAASQVPPLRMSNASL